MLVTRMRTVAFAGMEALPVDVEVKISSGLPKFVIVGLPDAVVSESRTRIKAALSTSLPAKEIIVNLSPAHIRKEGSHYDLPIALCLLAALKLIPLFVLDKYIAFGELSLDGKILTAHGVLLASMYANEIGKGMICSYASGDEAQLAGGDLKILAPRTVLELINFFKQEGSVYQPGLSLKPAFDNDQYKTVLDEKQNNHENRFYHERQHNYDNQFENTVVQETDDDIDNEISDNHIMQDDKIAGKQAGVIYNASQESKIAGSSQGSKIDGSSQGSKFASKFSSNELNQAKGLNNKEYNTHEYNNHTSNNHATSFESRDAENRDAENRKTESIKSAENRDADSRDNDKSVDNVDAICSLDFSQVKGQESAKLALLIAAAGGHHVLLVGPPGAGKSMLSSRLPSILPKLEPHIALESTIIHSLIGKLNGSSLITTPPWRDPHHSASMPALIGGGASALPGEISLAHGGVLFLDELPEFSRTALQSLRQAMETGSVSIARAQAHYTYPARFQLIAAMNPCQCGMYDVSSGKKCKTGEKCSRNYWSKISGPLLDRLDLCVYLQSLKPWELSNIGKVPEELTSKYMRAQVVGARAIQLRRQSTLNAHMDQFTFDKVITLTDIPFMQKIAKQYNLSGRGYHRMLKVARTIADLRLVSDPSDLPEIQHSDILQAVSFRFIWEH